MPLNGITLGQAITDPINPMTLITKYTSHTEYAIERQLINLCQFDHIKSRPMYELNGTFCIPPQATRILLRGTLTPG
jgi:hypothetical protein